jgi:type III secretory pathway lipoprotein EscJ
MKQIAVYLMIVTVHLVISSCSKEMIVNPSEAQISNEMLALI